MDKNLTPPEHLEKQPSIQGYIKQLIRADIEANGIPQTEKREEE